MRRRIAVAGDAALVRGAALRLGLQSAVGTALVVALVAVVIAVEFVRVRAAHDDAVLAIAVARADDVGDPPPGMWLTIRTATGQASTPGEPAGLPLTGALDRVSAGGPPEVTHVDESPRYDVLVRTQRRGTGGPVVQGVLDLAAGHRELARVLEALVVVGVLGLLLSAVAGSLLAARAVRPLQSALALQRRFVADAGHELRTPLTLLSTRAQMLSRRLHAADGTEAARADADGVVLDARRLAAILDDLLLAADPRSNADEPVDVAALAREVVEAAGPSASGAGVELVAQAPGPGVVTGSPAALRRAVTALVDNALRHAGSRVLVGVTAGSRSVVVEVADDGPGIGDDVLPRLFERFASGARRDDAGQRRYGLGLALVADVVARHGGSVTVGRSAAGGARFRVELPRAR